MSFIKFSQIFLNLRRKLGEGIDCYLFIIFHLISLYIECHKYLDIINNIFSGMNITFIIISH